MNDFEAYFSKQDNLIGEVGKLSERALALIDNSTVNQVTQFHQSIPGYQETQLVDLSDLAQKLGIKRILVKDESTRFDLKAFKGLGASFAIAQLISAHLGNKDLLLFDQLQQRKTEYNHLEFATTTDGNHGKAVAWSAHLLGCRSHIFMPKGTLDCRKEAIQTFTDHVEITDENYDKTVELCAKLAEQNQWNLIQDTAWVGYTEIPTNIMRGYLTICAEFSAQSELWPTHLFLQAGVGSFAAAVALYFYIESRSQQKPMPKVILVEPTNAACFYQSAKQAKPIEVGGAHETIMAGLACGKPSDLAWDILWPLTSAYFSCQDQLTIQGMQRFANPVANDNKIISGESAAITLGLLESLLTNPENHSISHKLGLNSSSVTLLFSTEGDTNPEYYQSLISAKQ